MPFETAQETRPAASDSSESGFVSFDRNGNFVGGNEVLLGAVEPDGKTENELCAEVLEQFLFEDVIPQQPRDVVAEIWGQGTETLQAVNTQGTKFALTSVPAPDGGRTYVAVPLKQPEAKSAGTATAQEMLHSAIQSMNEGVALWDHDFRLVTCNQAYADLTGLPQEMYTPGVQFDEMALLSSQGGTFVLAEGREVDFANQIINMRKKFSKNLEAETVDGRWVNCSCHKTDLGGVLFTIFDVTEQHLFEQAEKESAALLKEVVDACPANFLMSRLSDGEVLFGSPASKKLFGDRKSEKGNWSSLLDRARCHEALQRDGRVDDMFVIGVNAEGTHFPSQVSARLIEHNGEQVVVSSTTDLTDAYALRDENNRLNARLRDALETIDEGFALFDPDDRLVMANRRYKEANAGAAFSMTPGTHRRDIISAMALSGDIVEVDDWVEKYDSEAIKGKTNSTRSYELTHRDGTIFLASRSRTAEGGCTITWLDITERKRGEKAAHEADLLVRTIVESSPTSFLVSRVEDGEIIYCPPASRQRFGDLKTTLGFFLKPEDRQDYLDALLPTGTLNDYPVKFRRMDGSIMDGLTSARVIDFKGENVIVSSTRDITEQLALQAELELQKENAHQNEKLSALGELLAGVAHELNNPLSIVVGYALMLQDKFDDPVLQRRVERIGQAAERCTKIVKTFLAMARQRPARVEDVSLNELMEVALDVAAYGLKSTGARVTSDLSIDLPLVAADPDQLVQVFTNLIVNAEHALREMGEKGELCIKTKTVGAQVELTIADNGPGIAPDNLARIFEPFFTTKDVGSGTGVGLAFCHRIIESHGGSLSVESEPGKGALFRIRLNAVEGSGPVPAECEDKPQDIRQNRVLSVDDEEGVTDLIDDILSESGYIVTTCSDPRRALDLLKSQQFDAIISDMKMPGLTGPAFFSEIQRQTPEYSERIGFVTGDAMSETVADFLKESGRPCLEKPIAPADLVAFVEGLCLLTEDEKND